MDNSQLKSKMVRAAKWSSITEILAKVITPITNIILARILAPEAFGILATITMIISFVDMFTDSGFQKYLVQYQFKNKVEKIKHSNVAFWTNLFVSFFLWALVAIFNEDIAVMVGNPGLGNVIVIACIQLPLTSFSSIQMALYRREFDFRTLFWVRMVSVLLPFIITIPLALLGFNYWALIIGAICGRAANAILLTIKSEWKPEWFYSFSILKKMLSFSIWSLFEAISIWLTLWIDTFIIGYFLNEYYLGLYKTSTIMVNSLFALITGATTPVLFSALSRLQNDNQSFNNTFLKMQRLISILVFPLGVGVYLYSDLATEILLGSKWMEASPVIGIWALTSSIMIVFGHYCSELYRAKGQPKLSFLAQILHLIVLVPVCIIAANYGFWVLVYARSLIRLQSIIVNFIIMKVVIKFPIVKIFTNIFPMILASLGMGIVAFWLKQSFTNIVWSIFSIILCIVIYFGFLCLFKSLRKELFNTVINLKSGKSP